eukprot:9497812-Pyramimonas_sp.AAC.2
MESEPASQPISGHKVLGPHMLRAAELVRISGNRIDCEVVPCHRIASVPLLPPPALQRHNLLVSLALQPPLPGHLKLKLKAISICKISQSFSGWTREPFRAHIA